MTKINFIVSYNQKLKLKCLLPFWPRINFQAKQGSNLMLRPEREELTSHSKGGRNRIIYGT